MELLFYFYFLSYLFTIATTQQEPVLTFEDYFQFGKNEYTSKNWPDCIAFMKRAMDDFNQFEDDIVNCRQKCDRVVKKPTLDLKIASWHETNEMALCLTRCRRDRFGDGRPGIRKMTTYFDLMERKPYQYQHICFWNKGEFGMAVQAAYTFLVANPTDPDIISSLKYYMTKPEYSSDMLIDMERKEYESKFISGVEAYDEQDWTRCVHEFETSLEKAMKEDEKCRSLCQDKIDWSATDGNPEIDVLLASMRASVVRCEHNCLYKLGRINGHYVGNLIAAHYEYLHFCQFRLLRGTEAAQSVANYLLFNDSPLMRRNKHFYLKQYGKIDLFQPSEKIVKIYEQRELEKRYLDFVEKRFKLENNELPPEQADDHNPLASNFDISDNFDYIRASKLINNDSECKILRSALPNPQQNHFIKELTARVKTVWPDATFESATCETDAREASCERAIVFSAEKADCGEWLGKWFGGCAVVFCDDAKKDF